MIIGLLIVLLSGFLFCEAEIIHLYKTKKAFKIPLFKNPYIWYNSNNWLYSSDFVQFLMRYPFAFLKDGFHSVKSLAIVLFIIGLYFVQIESWEVHLLINYVVFSIGFNIRMHLI